MLTVSELQEHVKKLTYKPGWNLRVYEGLFEGAHFVVRAVMEDSYHPGQKVTLDIHSMLPPMLDTDAFENWIIWRLGRIEVHEAREWFKRDGKPVFDPHAEYAERDTR